MLPHLEVGHLPSSSSFYSAVVQPLGLRYLSAEDGHFPSITFGDARGRPAFEIRQITAGRDRPLITSHLVVSALLPEAAEDAYTSAVRANPEPRESTRRRPSISWPATSGISATRTIGGGGRIRIRIVDFDGNTMDVVYQPPSKYPPAYDGSTFRRTQSTTKEASRILDWNYDVATSDLRSVVGSDSRPGAGSTRTASRRPYSGAADEGPYSTLRRSVTDNSTLYESAPSPRQNSSGMSATTVLGTLVGVAAGAALGGALTYNMVKADRSHAPRQEFDPPAMSRRSTFPDPYPERKGRYVEVERAVEKVRYPDEYSTIVADRRTPPEYIAHYSKVSKSRSREAIEDPYDEPRGRHDSSRSRPSSVRRRSEAGSYRQPLLLQDVEHRSQVSKSSRHPPIVHRSYTYETPERDSYVTARSQRSSSTARPPPPPQVVSRSRSGGRMTTATIKVAGGSGSPRTLSRGNTYVAARNTGLPASGMGSSQAGWDDDDNVSIAPSDSISNVGSRRRGRAYH